MSNRVRRWKVLRPLKVRKRVCFPCVGSVTMFGTVAEVVRVTRIRSCSDRKVILAFPGSQRQRSFG